MSEKEKVTLELTEDEAGLLRDRAGKIVDRQQQGDLLGRGGFEQQKDAVSADTGSAVRYLLAYQIRKKVNRPQPDHDMSAGLSF